jgi:hypothetical protein
MIYLDEMVEHNVKSMFDEYVRKYPKFSEDLLEYCVEDYYSNNPVPVEKRPCIWMNLSNLLNKHYEYKSGNS